MNDFAYNVNLLGRDTQEYFRSQKDLRGRSYNIKRTSSQLTFINRKRTLQYAVMCCTGPQIMGFNSKSIRRFAFFNKRKVFIKEKDLHETFRSIVIQQMYSILDKRLSNGVKLSLASDAKEKYNYVINNNTFSMQESQGWGSFDARPLLPIGRGNPLL